jgi:hypothetical protein
LGRVGGSARAGGRRAGHCLALHCTSVLPARAVATRRPSPRNHSFEDINPTHNKNKFERHAAPRPPN